MGEDTKLPYIFKKTTRAEKILEEEALKEKCRLLIENAKEKRTKDSDSNNLDDIIFCYFYDNLKNFNKDDSKVCYKKIQDKIENDYFKTYISKIVSEEVEKQVEVKVKEELDKRLGKDDEDNYASIDLFRGNGTVSKALHHNYSKEDFEKLVLDRYNNYINTSLDKNDERIQKIKSDLYEVIENYNNNEKLDPIQTFLKHFTASMNKPSLMNLSSCKVKSKVKEALEEQGQTVSWLVRMTGIARSTMNSILTNSNEISLKNAYRISMVLEKPIEELFPFVVDRDYETGVIDTDNEK